MTKKLTANQRREWAKLLYTKDAAITLREMAAKVEVAESTIARWIKEEGWELQRQSNLVSRDAQLRSLNEQWNELNNAIKNKPPGERFPDSKEVVILLKLSAAIKNLETETGVITIMEVGKGFINYVRIAGNEHLKLVARLYDGYVKTRLK